MGVKIRLPPLPSVGELVKLYRVRALKHLSQNFLLERRVTDKIVRAARGLPGSEVCEVGPGPGSITRSIISHQPSRIVVIEKDNRFLPMLEMLQEASPCPMEVIMGDVLSFNMEKTFSEELKRGWSERPPNIHLIGNLPFNVATPLIIRWLRDISERRNAWKFGRVAMTLTFQKEVAERMVAPILTKQRCRLSVMCQNWCHVEHKFTIPGSAFVPKPDVDVGVVHLIPLVSPVIDLPFPLVEKVVRSLFSFRQKYCIRGIETLFPPGPREELAEKCLGEAEVAPTLRPLQLVLPEIGRICHSYNRLVNQKPKLAQYNYRQSGKKYFTDEDEDVSEEQEDKLMTSQI